MAKAVIRDIIEICFGFLFVAVFFGQCAGCNPRAAGITSSAVYGELVEAGCLAPAVDGVASTEAERGKSAWIDCLYDGGTVGACGVPCDAK